MLEDLVGRCWNICLLTAHRFFRRFPDVRSISDKGDGICRSIKDLCLTTANHQPPRTEIQKRERSKGLDL